MCKYITLFSMLVLVSLTGCAPHVANEQQVRILRETGTNDVEYENVEGIASEVVKIIADNFDIDIDTLCVAPYGSKIFATQLIDGLQDRGFKIDFLASPSSKGENQIAYTLDRTNNAGVHTRDLLYVRVYVGAFQIAKSYYVKPDNTLIAKTGYMVMERDI